MRANPEIRLGQRHVHPGRSLVPPQRAVRRQRPGHLPRRLKPSDFPAEHYERDWANRFRPRDLNDTGRRGLGLN